MTDQVIPTEAVEAAAEGWPECPSRSEGDKPHCPDCSGIVGETGIAW